MARNYTQSYFCIDVECVATDYSHKNSSKSVALVSVVNYDEREVLRLTVKPDKPVVSYLTPVTGLRAGDLDNGISLDEAIEQVKRVIGSDAILVGQKITHDIEWLKLKMGVDFQSYIDLSIVFKTYNPRYGKYYYFSLRHEADVLLGKGFITDQHDPATDGIASIKLFKMYYNADPRLLEEAKSKLLNTRPAVSWRKKYNYQYEGVCLSGFDPKNCICGAPTLQ